MGKWIGECSSCRFFKKWSSEEPDGPMGECRRYAPDFVPGYEVAEFPRLHETEWCGEYEKERSWKAS